MLFTELRKTRYATTPPVNGSTRFSVHGEFAGDGEERRGNGARSLSDDTERDEFGRDIADADKRGERTGVNRLRRRDPAIRRQESVRCNGRATSLDVSEHRESSLVAGALCKTVRHARPR